MAYFQRIACGQLCATALLALTLAAAAAAPPEGTTEAYASPLAGTAWQLVAIRSMDDSTYQPADRSLYTLDLQRDGTVSLRADCNRGQGRWRSDEPNQIAFGPIAATRALCPTPSLSERYLAQFEWVRSYVVTDGHLYLATMADGAIIEFEPRVADDPPMDE